MFENILSKDPQKYKKAVKDTAKALYPYGLSYYDDPNCKISPSSEWEILFTSVREAEEKNDTIENIEKLSKEAVAKYLKRDKTGEEIGYHASEKDLYMPMPYENQYHSHFAERKISYSGEIKNESAYEQLFGLEQNGRLSGSKNSGNYYHFINVISACAHFINFFSKPSNLSDLGIIHLNHRNIIMSGNPCFRNMRLIMAAYLHDIGKTLGNEGLRHAHTGAAFISSPNKQAREAMFKIMESYGYGDKWDESSVRIIGTFIKWHDLTGVISTGEGAVSMLSRLVYDFASLNLFVHEKTAQALFDFFILSCADIIVSIKNKIFPYKIFTCNPCGNDASEKEISDFFKSQKGKELLDDLILMLDLADEACEISKLPQDRLPSPQLGGIRRLRRLIQSSYEKPLSDKKIIDSGNQEFEAMLTELKKVLYDETRITSHISQAIAGAGFGTILNNMQNLGQLDYSLGFFQNIIQRVLEQILNEYNNTPEFSSGWITVPNPGKSGEDTVFLAKNNAERIIQGCLAVIISIIEEIHKILPSITGDMEITGDVWNVEFMFAGKTLTSDPNLLNSLLQWGNASDITTARSTLIKSVMFYRA